VPSLGALALAIHVASTWAMVGIIWFVQLVQYPLFAEAGAAEFRVFHAAHVRRITWVVAPLMLLEGATGLYVLVVPPGARWLPAQGLGLLLVIWGSTAWLQVPRHNELSRGFDPVAWRRLVRSNWVRTAAWTARGAIVIAMLLGS
jgi:hypothetical protein